jgi:hypothetical protein
MNSNYPASVTPPREEERKAPPSRLGDEKISDDTGAEAQMDKALAPAGLKNPFWK